MNPTLVAWTVFAGVIAYACSVDPNVLLFLSLVNTRVSQVLKLRWYSLQWNPRYPWARYRIRMIATRNSQANATLLMKELGIPED